MTDYTVELLRPRALKSPFKTVADFCAEYVPLAYIAEPVIRSSSLYTLTAKTGAGKTGFLTVLALAIATGRQEVIGMDVERGRVAYVACENPDDIRMRLMVAGFALNVDLHDLADDLVILDRRMKPDEVIDELCKLAKAKPFSLVIVDTLAAFFDGRDINDNVQGGDFMRRLRPMCQLPGLPSVIVAAHPVKNAADDALVPYGGGAILNEVDGNLTLSKKADSGTVSLSWQGKLRGLEFSAIPFRFDLISSPDVVDRKGRQVTLPVLRRVTEADVESREKAEVNRDVALLKVMLEEPNATQREWSAKADIALGSVVRRLPVFEKRKLVEKTLAGKWQLTVKGKKEVELIP